MSNYCFYCHRWMKRRAKQRILWVDDQPKRCHETCWRKNGGKDTTAVTVHWDEGITYVEPYSEEHAQQMDEITGWHMSPIEIPTEMVERVWAAQRELSAAIRAIWPYGDSEYVQNEEALARIQAERDAEREFDEGLDAIEAESRWADFLAENGITQEDV